MWCPVIVVEDMFVIVAMFVVDDIDVVAVVVIVAVAVVILVSVVVVAGVAVGVDAAWLVLHGRVLWAWLEQSGRSRIHVLACCSWRCR